MNKKIIAIALITGVLSSCGSTASASSVNAEIVLEPVTTTHSVSGFFKTTSTETMLGADLKRAMAKRVLQKKLDSVIKQVKSRVGKTWYVFSGATPRGWDCSGLTMWTYEQLGIEIPHSATKQAGVGAVVTDPKPGDIVLFGYKGYKSYYHAALYIGGGKVVHAGFRKGTTTAIIPISSPAFKNSRVTFIRLLDTSPING